MVNLAIVGIGYWGSKLFRNFLNSKKSTITHVFDLSEKRINGVLKDNAGIRPAKSLSEIADNTDIDGVIIATPPQSHYETAKLMLEKGKHVFVEKPLALLSSHCRELMDIADRNRKVLMVGHTFLYNNALRKLKEYIWQEDFGQIYYIYSSRLNLGIIRQDVNALWNFAPHDVSILNYLLNSRPVNVTARGFSYIQKGIEDVVFMTLDFENNVSANVHLSWLDPNKVREITVVGSKRMIIYDDVSTESKLMIFDRGVKQETNLMKEERSGSFGEFQLQIYSGDVLIPKIDFVEPLKLESEDFINAIANSTDVLSGGLSGYNCVCVLESAQESINKGGTPVKIKY